MSGGPAMLYALDALLSVEQWLLAFGVTQTVFFRRGAFNRLCQSQHRGCHVEVVDISRLVPRRSLQNLG